MRAIIIFIVLVAICSGVWWFVEGITPMEQIRYLQTSFNNSRESEMAGNTAKSASKLGKVLKNSFDDAQDVYQNGAEAKYE